MFFVLNEIENLWRAATVLKDTVTFCWHENFHLDQRHFSIHFSMRARWRLSPVSNHVFSVDLSVPVSWVVFMNVNIFVINVNVVF